MVFWSLTGIKLLINDLNRCNIYLKYWPKLWLLLFCFIFLVIQLAYFYSDGLTLISFQRWKTISDINSLFLWPHLWFCLLGCLDNKSFDELPWQRITLMTSSSSLHNGYGVYAVYGNKVWYMNGWITDKVTDLWRPMIELPM